MRCRKINKKCCATFVYRRVVKSCKNPAITHEKIAEWRETGRITADQAAAARTIRPLCHKHLANFLDDLAPGTKAKIIGNAFKGWKRNYINGLTTLWAMRRAGLGPNRQYHSPTPNRQCTATSKKAGRRCRNWRMYGTPVCRWHGAGGVFWHRMTEAERIEARKRKHAKALARCERWLERQARRAAGLLPPTTGFTGRPQPSLTPLEDEFRRGTGRKSSD